MMMRSAGTLVLLVKFLHIFLKKCIWLFRNGLCNVIYSASAKAIVSITNSKARHRAMHAYASMLRSWKVYWQDSAASTRQV